MATCAFLLAVLAAAEPAPLAGGQTVTFHEAVERAMTVGIDASLAELAVGDAHGAELGLRSALSPNVYAGLTYTRLDHDRGLAGGRLLASREQLNVQLNAIVPAFAPRRWADYRLAKQATRLASYRHHDAQRTAAIQAANAYLDVVTSKRAIDVGEQAVATGRAHFAIAEARLKAGIGNRLDVLRADDALGESEVLLQNSRAQAVLSMERLGVVLGRNAPADVADEWPAALDVAPRCTYATAHSFVAKRADLELAYERLRLLQRTRQYAWLDYLPLLLATGQFFVQDPPTSQYPKHGWQLQALLTLPVFENGLRRGLREQRRVAEHQAQLTHGQLERQALADLRASHGVLLESEQAVRMAQRRREAAGQSVTLTARAYARGTITSLEVVDAERRGRDAATAAAVAEDNVRRARLNYLVAAGLFPGEALAATEGSGAGKAPSGAVSQPPAATKSASDAAAANANEVAGAH